MASLYSGSLRLGPSRIEGLALSRNVCGTATAIGVSAGTLITNNGASALIGIMHCRPNAVLLALVLDTPEAI